MDKEPQPEEVVKELVRHLTTFRKQDEAQTYVLKQLEKLHPLTSIHAKKFYQTFYSGKEFKKNGLNVEELNRNFRLYFRTITGKHILDTVENKKLITRAIDYNNNLDIDLNEINEFF